MTDRADPQLPEQTDETWQQEAVRERGGCGKLLNDGRDVCIREFGHEGGHGEQHPGPDEATVGKVAEALERAFVDAWANRQEAEDVGRVALTAVMEQGGWGPHTVGPVGRRAVGELLQRAWSGKHEWMRRAKQAEADLVAARERIAEQKKAGDELVRTIRTQTVMSDMQADAIRAWTMVSDDA